MLLLRYLIGLLWLFLFSNVHQDGVSEQITLGRTGPDCAGRGVCGFSRTAGGEGNTQVTYNRADSLLVVSIIRNRLTADEMLQQFGTKNTSAELPEPAVFAAEADYLLSRQLKQDLYIPDGITKIKSGSYPVVQTSGLIIVKFKLQ